MQHYQEDYYEIGKSNKHSIYSCFTNQNIPENNEDDNEDTNEITAMESDITENAIGKAYSLVNTSLSQLCECYYRPKPPHFY